MAIQALAVLPENSSGRDFVVGDLHGCYDAFIRQLEQNDFDPDTDRVMCVGDLVDRGPDSYRCLGLSREHWFHTTWGNHEDLMLRGLSAGQASSAFRLWMYNGGDWALRHDLDELHEQVKTLAASTSLAIEVPVGDQRIGLVHAEVPGDQWACWSSKLTGKDREEAIWGRHTVKKALQGRDAPPVGDIDQVIFGHTPLRSPARVANRLYLDTGGGYPGGEPTLLDAQDALTIPFDSSPHPFRPGA
ncbi:serine/threonine protein phosphatase 1 [Marinobacter daqiaonensis]|uniref:Serine/threonine protein phosphatase 1 n=1 Tax=Marinobacter daqiaonensis TaxID=650891 RepID=A0A1I6H7E8_9GAMM|nr:metallophosphoesterase [Marinobacter daqiaonensis]SFR50413.1 serine/threonine protein phosphatase 1 [Marinobacter daqiaonensis]